KGEWSGLEPLDITYQWQRCDSGCTDISGAVESTYFAAAADIGQRLRVRVTASNPSGSAAAVSAESEPIGSGAPAMGLDDAPWLYTSSYPSLVGEQVFVDVGPWTGSGRMTYGYRWQRCDAGGCTDIAGATEETYVI